MCGITGFYIQGKDYKRSNLNENLYEMTNSLSHRGPDDIGTWLNLNNNIGLGQTRLSIRDLSKNGSQPMFSACGNYIIVYNGEIYDNNKIKSLLEKKNIRLKSSSDTELLLENISNFGLDSALENSNGMFAFALFDIKKKKLFLIRDRMGIKPLFYYQNNNNFAFASEIKALKKFLNFKSSLNVDALNSFLKYGFNRNYSSIYQNIKQVKPGEIIEIDQNLIIKKKLYWKTNNFFKDIKNNTSLSENINELENLIKDAVKIRLESDVEVGSFLSGGIDSSLISQVMSEVSEKKINTFSVGFIEKDYDESRDAREIAKYIGSNHHEILIGEKELLNVFDNLPNIYDEPFADSSQIPTAIVSNYARKYAGVILSGDGGDELFGGYTRYLEAKKQIDKKEDIEINFKKKIGRIILNLNPNFIKLIEKLTQKHNLVEKSKNYLKFHHKENKTYLDFLCQWHSLNEILENQFISDELKNEADYDFIKNDYEKFMAYDLNEYLPNDILTKVDRASMNYGLEVRVPLLDYRIVKFSSRLKIDNKISSNYQKRILKEVLKKRIPNKLIKNKKVGFGIPIDEWLRSFLKERVDYLLSKECLGQNPYLNSATVQKLWFEHQNNIQNHGIKLWNIISFQNWININKEFLIEK